MAPVLKTGVPERVSGVRIPPSPPASLECRETSQIYCGNRRNWPHLDSKEINTKREFSHLNPVERLAAQIIDRLDWLGGQTTKRSLERSVSAHKPYYLQDAWELILRRCIQPESRLASNPYLPSAQTYGNQS
jgi:hypothetical protein